MSLPFWADGTVHHRTKEWQNKTNAKTKLIQSHSQMKFIYNLKRVLRQHYCVVRTVHGEPLIPLSTYTSHCINIHVSSLIRTKLYVGIFKVKFQPFFILQIRTERDTTCHEILKKNLALETLFPWIRFPPVAWISLCKICSIRCILLRLIFLADIRLWVKPQWVLLTAKYLNELLMIIPPRITWTILIPLPTTESLIRFISFIPTWNHGDWLT